MVKASTTLFIRRALRHPAIVAATVILPFVTMFVFFRFFPPGPNIVCHRFIDSTVSQWMLETTNEVWLPNVNGKSADSLALLLPYYGSNLDDLKDYRYIPGLKTDDPDDLVRFYLIEPSRRTWHGDLYLPWHPKRWIVISVHSLANGGDGELSESLTASELKSRLGKTIEFLKKNKRVGWQNAEAEHSPFLNSLKE